MLFAHSHVEPHFHAVRPRHGIPPAFSIAEGIGLGMVAAALIALGTGRPRSLPVAGHIIAVVFFLKFLHIFPFTR